VESRTFRCAFCLAVFVLGACALVAAAAPDAGSADAAPEPLSPVILEALTEKGQIDLIVFLWEQAWLEGASEMADRADRGRYVYQALREVARCPLSSVLCRQRHSGDG
jgi:hypothetical protein